MKEQTFCISHLWLFLFSHSDYNHVFHPKKGTQFACIPMLDAFTGLQKTIRPWQLGNCMVVTSATCDTLTITPSLPVSSCTWGVLKLWIFLKWYSDDRAIHFIQAEKLYYENALISTEEIQKKLGKWALTCFYQLALSGHRLSTCWNIATHNTNR